MKHNTKRIAQGMQETITIVDSASVSLIMLPMPPDITTACHSKVVAVVTDAASCNTCAMPRLLPLYSGTVVGNMQHPSHEQSIGEVVHLGRL